MCNEIFDVVEIGIRIKERMKELDINASKLARKAKCGTSSISRYLKGQVPNPYFNEIARIATALEVSIDWLCHGDDEEEDEEKAHNQINDNLDILNEQAKKQLNIHEKRYLLQSVQIVVDTSFRNAQAKISSQSFQVNFPNKR